MKGIAFNLLVFLLIALCGCNIALANPRKGEASQSGGNSGSEEEGAEAMTPYSTYVSTDKFLSGATLSMDSLTTTSAITTELERMKKSFNINTVTVYGLEGIAYNLKSHLFSELARLGMKIVVRIESYDASSFSFTESDAESVCNSYDDLLSFVSSSDSRKGAVAYFAVNMPADDTTVQKNAGGLNSTKWKNAQVTYAKKIIELLRASLKKKGFTDTKLYLSVHYGWDNSFDIPSYASANADGYFINNYSYPKNGVPTADDSDGDLINSERLAVSMNKYKNQYGNAPVVMEFGFHTVEYNKGKTPAQTAGLVQDKEAKEKALKATYKYYTENWPQVQGFLYFGFNLLKEEGSDNAVMDWCLAYPSEGKVRALDAVLSDDVTVDGGLITLTEKGSTAVYRDCGQLQSIAVEYRSEKGATVVLKADGRKRAEAVLPPQSSFTTYGIPVVVAEGFDLTIELAEGDLTIKSVNLLENLEGEYGTGEKSVGEDEKASNGLYASSITDGITFSGVRGGEKLVISYSAEEKTTVTFSLDGKSAKLSLPASKKFATKTVSLPIYRGADLTVTADRENFKLDYISLTGIPQ